MERTLPDLLEKSLQRGWRVLVKGGDVARLDFLDEFLWTYREDSFLPHGRDNGEAQPVYLTNNDEEPNNADIIMLVDGANYPVDKLANYQRACLLFDGNDQQAVAQARIEWKAVVGAKLPAKYWAQEDGRWVQKSESNP